MSETVTIPFTPTREMLVAGAKMFEATLYSSADYEHHAFHVYCAMLDAFTLEQALKARTASAPVEAS